MKPVEIRKEHEWLARLAGDWAYELEMSMGPDQPSMRFSGTEHVRLIAGIWAMAEGKGPMPDGTTSTTMLTLGFDSTKGTFVGTWLGSMMDYLWSYTGTLNGNALELDTVGPSHFPPDTHATFKEVITLNDDGTRGFASSIRNADGSWMTVMTGVYRRA